MTNHPITNQPMPERRPKLRFPSEAPPAPPGPFYELRMSCIGQGSVAGNMVRDGVALMLAGGGASTVHPAWLGLAAVGGAFVNAGLIGIAVRR